MLVTFLKNTLDKREIRETNYEEIFSEIVQLTNKLNSMRYSVTDIKIISHEDENELNKLYKEFRERLNPLSTDYFDDLKELDDITKILNEQFEVKGEKYYLFIKYKTFELTQNVSIHEYNNVKNQYQKRIKEIKTIKEKIVPQLYNIEMLSFVENKILSLNLEEET